jgi:hypothetical protein
VQEEQLRQDLAGLADDDILALCYAFKSKTARLRLYLDVMRRRGGQRAQFASCLICFDLARQGDASFQREFLFLADTVRQLAQDKKLVETLIGTDDYLRFIWELCQASLDQMNASRAEFGGEVPVADETLATQAFAPDDHQEDLGSIELLDDADFDDFGIATDDATLWRRFDDAVEAFLGGVVGMPVYDVDAGFRVKNNRDIERIERFLHELESLRELVPPARGFRALALLFFGTSMRSKGLFGGINERKQELLREGVQEFVVSGLDVWEIAGVLGPMHAAPDVWPRIAEVLLDYVRWMAQFPGEAATGVSAYDPVARQVDGTAHLAGVDP